MPEESAGLVAARTMVGTPELPGPIHNSKLLAFLNTASRWNGLLWKNDEVPWCGGFVAACLLSAGIDPVKVTARAKSWASWGADLRLTHLAPGAVLVFGREGGRHVGFYVGEGRDHLPRPGQRPGNRVCVTRIPKSRLIAARWPRSEAVIGAPVKMKVIGGVPMLRNEA